MEKKISNIISPIAEDLKLEIVRVKLINSSRVTLEILIDRLDGQKVTISDCALFSRKISLLLEEQDPIASRYILEISSPGINRPLISLLDFDKYKNNNVVIKLRMPIEISNDNNQQLVKKVTGYLIGIKEEIVLIKMETGNTIDLDYKNISSAKLDINL